MILLIISAVLALCSASWGSITPSDRIAFVDLRNLHLRRPRQVLDPDLHIRRPRQVLEGDRHIRRPRQVLEAPHPGRYQVNEEDQGYQTWLRNQFRGIPIPVQPYAPIPIRLPQHQEEPIAIKTQEPQSLAETRPPDFGEYIDFGAHTGDNGAFGWYADYPLTNNHEGGYQHRH